MHSGITDKRIEASSVKLNAIIRYFWFPLTFTYEKPRLVKMVYDCHENDKKEVFLTIMKFEKPCERNFYRLQLLFTSVHKVSGHDVLTDPTHY